MHVFFRAREAATFDWDRYVNNHLPLAREKLGEYGLISINAQRCAPGPDGKDPANVAVVTLDFEDGERFKTAFKEAAPGLIANVPHFTNVEPVFSFGEVAE
jgi:uncharacterized protein (TIGR02118 family)